MQFNLDVLDGDADPNARPLTLVGIIDPTAPGTVVNLVQDTAVRLASGTTVTRLADNTLDITTAVLASGTERFEYVIRNDEGATDNGTVTLTKTPGNTVNFDAVANGTEDNQVDLNMTVDPSLTAGGALPNLAATEIGFRDQAAGSTPTTFTIAPNTNAVRITALGSNNDGTAANNIERFQRASMLVDLTEGTYGGQLFFMEGTGPNGSDIYSFSDVALGSASDSGTISGENNAGTRVTVSVSGDTLSIVDAQSRFDQAYLVEYLTSGGSSADFLGSRAAVMFANTTSSTIALPTNADYAVLTLQDSREGLATEQPSEDRGSSRIVVDLETNRASGVIFTADGRGEASTAAYAFSDYDITSGSAVIASGATRLGDSTADADILQDLTLTLSGGNLVVTRTAGIANNPDGYTTLVNVQAYERLDIGSSAQSLGTDEVVGTYLGDSGTTAAPFINEYELTVPSGAQTAELSFALTTQVGDGVTTNENSIVGQTFVDFENNVVAGSFLSTRAGEPDLIAFSDLPIGSTQVLDGPNTVSNQATLAEFSDNFVAVLSFDVEDRADGSRVLKITAPSTGGLNIAPSEPWHNWGVNLQAQFAGRPPVVISGFPADGTFSAGSLNPETGAWEVVATEAAGLDFIPGAHYSGTSSSVSIAVGENVRPLTINVARVADAPTLTTTDQGRCRGHADRHLGCDCGGAGRHRRIRDADPRAAGHPRRPHGQRWHQQLHRERWFAGGRHLRLDAGVAGLYAGGRLCRHRHAQRARDCDRHGRLHRDSRHRGHGGQLRHCHHQRQ